MPRGGKRPGAGAKPGNVNALKHGRNSVRLRQLLPALLEVPEFRQLLFVLRRQRLTRDRATRQALRLLFPTLDAFLPPLAPPRTAAKGPPKPAKEHSKKRPSSTPSPSCDPPLFAETTSPRAQPPGSIKPPSRGPDPDLPSTLDRGQR